MAVFEYKGFNTEGKTVAGIIDADSPKTARVKLRKSGVYPTEVFEGGSQGKLASSSAAADLKRFRWGERVGLLDLSVATRQLATLLAANLPLMEALTALVDQVDHKELKKVIASIREQVREGGSLAAAMNHHPRVFSDVYINMVHAGETSGSLDGMLLRLSDFLEYQVKLRNRLIATFTYPIFMLVIGSLILFGLITFVVPKVTAIFEEMHQALPLPTVLLINLSHFLSNYWWLLLLLGLASAVAVERYIRTSKGRTQYDRLLMRLPLLGRVTLLVALSRFTRTLSTLLMSGVSLLTALDVVKNVVHLTPLADAIEQARENVREGQSLAEPLRKSGLFPALITHMIAIGEKSGELEPMLIKVSEAYDNEVETTITTFTALLGPVMILLMGVIILFIVLAVLLPIFELSQVVR
jgi:general secretion pathway protein F